MIDRATDIAKDIVLQPYKLGAVITDRRGKVLSEGRNSFYKTHPIQAHFASQCGKDDRIYLHAEIDALISCEKPQKAYSIWVARVNLGNEITIAKPCDICHKALMNLSSIKYVYFTTEKGGVDRYRIVR